MNKQLTKIGVVGSGRIASDTATLFAGNGYKIALISRSEDGCQRAKLNIEENFEQLRKEGLLTEEQIIYCLSFVTFSTDLQELAKCQFVFEAIVENLELKGELYHKIEQICNPVSIIVSTTSGIAADDLAAWIQKKDRFIIGHSWNPPHLIPLVEIVRNADTSDETVKETVSLLESTGRKIVILKKSIDGFIGNRIMHAMFREALYLVESGIAEPEDIDRAILYSFGQRFSSIGLLEYYDAVGLDLQYNVESYLFKSLCNADSPQKYLTQNCSAGKLGLKTGQGIFDWTQKDIPDFNYRKSKPYFQYFNWEIPTSNYTSKGI
jgi:3-hydroxybutyryl-CoA dehydrogenase